MNILAKLGTNMSRKMANIGGRNLLKIRKVSPQICFVVGTVSFIGTVVLSSKATLKVDEVLDEHKENNEKFKDALDKVEQGKISKEVYSYEDYRKDLVINYSQTGIKLIKLYGPTVLCGAISIGCFASGHVIMKNRQVAILAGYKAIEEAFTRYRNRVIEDYGPERDFMYKHDLRESKTTIIETNEKGKTKTSEINELVKIDEAPSRGAFTRDFNSQTSSEWANTLEYNLVALKSQQKYYNDILLVRGHVFFNEILDALGLERSPEGAIFGWVKNKGDDDVYIDFGIFNPVDGTVNDHNVIQRNNIILDFNVQELPIYNLI